MGGAQDRALILRRWQLADGGAEAMGGVLRDKRRKRLLRTLVWQGMPQWRQSLITDGAAASMVMALSMQHIFMMVIF